MSSDAKVRIVAFVSSTIAEQYAALSRRFGLSRSELVRMALQRGYRSIAVWCENTVQILMSLQAAWLAQVRIGRSRLPRRHR